MARKSSNLPRPADASPRTLGEWIAHAALRFSRAQLWYGHGTHNAPDEAAWLVQSVAGIPHERLGEAIDRELTPAQQHRAARLIRERISRRSPLAYLLREAWLGEHRFYVDERVIVPRSLIAELVPARLRPWVASPRRIRRILDLCTGSGCLAVLLAAAFPGAKVDAADISPAALSVARRNVSDYGLGTRIRLVRSDLFEQLAGEQYDLIVANPPYVDARAMKDLPQEYRREPGLALSGGQDGLDFVRRILSDSPAFLAPGGLLIVEIGHNRRALERAFPRLPFTWLDTSAGGGLVFLLARESLTSC